MPWDTTPGTGSLGPCSSWIDPATLTCGTGDMTVYAAAASQLLYEWSARLFPGSCTRIVRPCGRGGCWTDPASQRWQPFWTGAAWTYGDGSVLCGCQAISRVPLAGYPATSITQVAIDGSVVSPAEYRLDEARYLTRLDGWWPFCQNLRAAPDEAGSFVVTYQAGSDPPAPGVLAAQELACWLYDQFALPDCAPPSAVTNITRQGVTYQRDPTLPKAKQLPLVSEFLDAYNPRGMRRRPAFFSPDLEQAARPEGV